MHWEAVLASFLRASGNFIIKFSAILSFIDSQFRRFFLEAFGQYQHVDDAYYYPGAAQNESYSIQVNQQVQTEDSSQYREDKIHEDAFGGVLLVSYEIVGNNRNVDEAKANESSEIDIRSS